MELSHQQHIGGYFSCFKHCSLNTQQKTKKLKRFLSSEEKTTYDFGGWPFVAKITASSTATTKSTSTATATVATTFETSAAPTLETSTAPTLETSTAPTLIGI